ncbi:hypothetical protein M407DRAFT_109859 [Tulasnella calospora MUT 4182]|uniref:DNA-binding TFAR19-related protein n=1 Tax=Tulasnella calospora MUT 4182 TaxID=1051891 RepID=A0A0C3KPX4_9AGAM|nr:hypothetical protein M407DRAFT_109859 [Tulasnella calospora MUT 4182]
MADQDPELQAIRAARLSQLQKQGGSTNVSANGQSDPDAAEKRKEEDQMRRDLLATVLDSSARERLSRISLVNPSLSKQMESILLRMAQSGQLRSRVTEEQLIGLLEQAEAAQAKTAPKTTISYQRRKAYDDDDEFDI